MPRLRFLRRAHDCNYCHGVHGVTFAVPGKVRPRILWVKCRCGKSHYICHDCAAKVGSSQNGERYVADCAKGYARRLKNNIAAKGGEKGDR